MFEFESMWDDYQPKKKKSSKKKASTPKKKSTTVTKKQSVKKHKSDDFDRAMNNVTYAGRKTLEGGKKAAHWTLHSKPGIKAKETASKLKNNSIGIFNRTKKRIETRKPKFCPNCGSKETVHQFPNGQYGCYKCNAVWGNPVKKV